MEGISYASHKFQILNCSNVGFVCLGSGQAIYTSTTRVHLEKLVDPPYMNLYNLDTIDMGKVLTSADMHGRYSKIRKSF